MTSQQGVERQLPTRVPDSRRRPHPFTNSARKFGDQDNPDERLQIARAIGKGYTKCNLAQSGAMILATAFQLTDPEARLGLIEEAEALLRRSTVGPVSTNESYVTKARLTINSIDIFRCLLMDVRVPLSVLEKAHDREIDLAVQLNNIRTDTVRYNNRERKTAAGGLAEVSVNSLINRFALRDLGDTSMVAVTSFYDEDYSGRQRDSRYSWDCSVYTDAHTDPNTNDLYELTYPIQVKSSMATSYYEGSAPGIVTVYLKEDLRLNGTNGMPLGAVATELSEERAGLYGNVDTSTVSLDARTQLLLDKMDN